MMYSERKKGVSLIAVLLFMLVATIAATATFKWLSSSYGSSGSRMMQKEAYQSAVAGLENARTWMTYHANDVGSLIKQYKDGGNKAISLNSQLKALTRAGQDYDVWLVGANTESSTYKLKILSAGKARNGSVHNEVGIFNVDGLYQVNIPQKTTSATVDFDYAYFGGSYKGAGDVEMSGAVVNGDWSGNPQKLTQNFVVTGDISLSGSGIDLGKLACIGGDAKIENHGITAKDLYIGGNVTGAALNVTGDARFDGNVSQGSVGALDIKGSASLHGTMTVSQAGDSYWGKIGKNLCIWNDGKLVSNGTNTTLEVVGNIWSENNDPLGTPGNGENEGNYDKIILGSDNTSKLYMHAKSESQYASIYNDVKSYYQNYGSWTGYHHFESRSGSATNKYFIFEPLKVEFKKSGDYYNYFLNDVVFALEKYSGVRSFNSTSGSPYCKDAVGTHGVTCNATYETCDPFLAKYSGNSTEGHNAYRPICYVRNWFKSNGTVEYDVPDQPPFSCGDSLKQKCDNIWYETDDGCDGSKYRVDDILSTASLSKLEEKASLGCRSSITSFSNGMVDALNKCYKRNVDTLKAADNLFNGYQVVKVSGDGGETCNGWGTLDGKFIIIAEDQIKCQNGLMPTTTNSKVFLYLKNGADKLKEGYRYFIYSLKDITEINGSGNFQGTIYMPSKSCAKVGKMQGTKLKTDTLLLKDLANAGIICNNVNDQSCGSGGSFGSGTASGTTTSSITLSGLDSYYIANAPQLSVTLESEYKSTEGVPQASQTVNLAGDFIVLPRVIYMPRDPYGKLSDYYNVIPLNGLNNFNESSGSVSCDPSDIPTSGDLYNHSGSGALLSSDYYKCQYSYGGKSVPFHILVNGESGSAPMVHFTEPNVKMGSSTSHEVKISIPAHTTAITVNVIKPTGMDATWSISENGGTCSGNSCAFTFAANTEITEPTIFNVTTTNAGNGTAIFQLLSGEGYTVSTPSTEVLYIASSVTINREDIPVSELEAYCSEHSGCPADKSSWPDCPATTTWVTAIGSGCTSSTPNNQWNCGIASDISLASGSTPAGCVVIVPSKTLAQGDLEVGGTYSLPATAKAQAMKFYFGFSGDDGLSGKEIVAKITNSTASGRLNTTKSCVFGADVSSTADHCEMTVFKGESIELSFPGDRPSNFNYWSCSGADCPAPTNSGEKFNSFAVMNDGDVIIAHFDETDRHCFFDEFKTGTECSQQYCIGSAGAKWRSSDVSKIDYQYGYVAAETNKNDATGTVVMSTAETGLHGTLKAQFQVPRVAKSKSATIPASVSNSGFILHSSDLAGTDYLSLSLYADNEGVLTAVLCDKDASTCRQKTFGTGTSALTIDYSNTIITLSADIGESDINLTAYTGTFGSVTSYSATFDLSDGFSDYKTIGQYVGFRLADPNFKLYDIGWRSEDYGSECWDTYPTVNCSFKAAYAGGYVPKKTDVTPWVGLSSWFDAKDCAPHYYYNGDDGNCGSGDGYVECTSGHYYFTTSGAHGYTSGSTEIKTAKAGVGNCFNITGEKDKLLAETERAHCGAFWVDTVTYCKQNVDFSGTGSAKTISAGDIEYFNLPSGVANLRDATLKIDVSNDNASKIEIYMTSQQEGGTETFFSKSMETTAKGTISISTESLSDADGFDVQRVVGVAVKVISGEDITVSKVYTACPNVVSIDCSDHVGYNANTGKWEISADVTNYRSVKSLKITEESGYISQRIFDCENSECPVTENGKTGTYSFEIADNPYATSSSKNYKFGVEITTNDETLSCNTNEVDLAAIMATCGSLSATEAKQGKGIPQFTYSMTNCPSSGCPYEIKLLDESGTEVVSATTGSTNVSNGHTISTIANTSTKLNLGKYKFSLASTSADKPFTSCESAEFEVIKNPDDYKDPTTNCWFGDNGEQRQLGGNGHFKYDVLHKASYLKGVPYKLKHTVDGTEVEVASGTTCGNSDCEITIPASPYGLTYTLYLKVNDDYEESCQASLPIKVTSAKNCKLEKGKTEMSATDTDNFVFDVTNSCTGSVCSYALVRTLNGTTDTVSTGNPVNDTYKPTITGPGVYTVWINGVEQTGCSITVTGKRPSFTCSDKYVGVGDIVSFTPSNLTECGDDCTYSFYATNDATFPSGMSGPYSGSEISFNGRNSEVTENYTLTIANSNGSNSCTFNVTYASNSCTTINWPSDGDKVQGDSHDQGKPSDSYPWSGSDCYIVQSDKICTGQIKFKSEDCKGRDFTWNGVSIHLRESDGYLDMDPNPGPGEATRIEGMGTCRVTQFWMSGCYAVSAATAAPSLTCPTNMPDLKPGTAISIDLKSLSNCNVTGGCTYSITGGSTPLTGTIYSGNLKIPGESSNITANYSMTFTNSVGVSSACAFSVTFDSNAPETVDITNTGNNTGGPLTSGTYKVVAVGSCSNVRFNCANNGTNCSIKVGSESASSGVSNSSNNVLSPKPVAGDVLTVTGTVSNIWCAGW